MTDFDTKNSELVKKSQHINKQWTVLKNQLFLVSQEGSESIVITDKVLCKVEPAPTCFNDKQNCLTEMVYKVKMVNTVTTFKHDKIFGLKKNDKSAS